MNFRLRLSFLRGSDFPAKNFNTFLIFPMLY
jgi:hypothetical protein